MADTVRLYCAGFLLNPTEGRRFVCLPEGALAVDGAGRIRAWGPSAELRRQFPGASEEHFGPTSVLLPGLVDVHTHLPQYQAMGIGHGELLPWLHELIFPLESRFADAEFARHQAELFFRAALRHGTTTLLVFGPPFAEATDCAFAVAAQLGLRVLMGQTLMDCNVPEPLRTSPEQARRAIESLLQRWHGYDGRLAYVVTPRFAGSCTLELLRLCADLARQHGLLLQTHLAESRAELRWIAQLYPDYPDYTAIYEATGMLSPQTVLAHCIYLSPSERARLRAADCALAHCPRSNAFLRSGIMPLRLSLQEGFRVGLGTDVGAGYSPSMLEEARAACEMAKLRAFLAPEEEPTTISAEEALWLATLGGASALGLESSIGSFAAGKEADFLVLDSALLEPREALHHDAAALIARIVYTATPEALRAVFVRGRLCYSSRS